MRKVTFDIETSSSVPGGWDLSSMQLTIVGVHDSETDLYTSYTVEELPQMWPIFERADMLIGFNSDHFDIPILNKYYAGDLTKIRSLDILKEVKNVLGRRIKLDSIAKATLGKKKSGHGLDAVEWWKQGKVEKVRAYCIDDVKLTKQIYDYALLNKKLAYDDFGKKKEILLDTSNWETAASDALTHTLPW